MILDPHYKHLIIYANFLPHNLTNKLHMSKTNALPEDGHQLWPKGVGVLINE